MPHGEIRNFIVSNYLFGVDNGFADTDSFLERGLIDSTGVLELVAFLQERFGVEVEDGDLVPENLDSVERVCSYVKQKLAVSHQ